MYLLQLGIITNKRGIGHFVESDAVEKALALRTAQFMKYELPAFLKNLHLLKIDLAEVGVYARKNQNGIV